MILPDEFEFTVNSFSLVYSAIKLTDGTFEITWVDDIKHVIVEDEKFVRSCVEKKCWVILSPRKNTEMVKENVDTLQLIKNFVAETNCKFIINDKHISIGKRGMTIIKLDADISPENLKQVFDSVITLEKHRNYD